jgi:hypothetical protein
MAELLAVVRRRGYTRSGAGKNLGRPGVVQSKNVLDRQESPMPDSVSRRHLLAVAPALGFAAASSGGALAAFAAAEPAPADPAGTPSPVGATFPTQEADLAREMVGVSHGNVARVRELLALHPTLALATWDWGFGDWETSLGAASHVGNREIAELLIAHGARPDLFAATMLGQLETVKAYVASQPGCQRIPGPHGITRLSHAKAGGERAAAVLAWLEQLGGADEKPATQPLADADQAAILGSYRFGAGESESVEVAVGKFGLTFQRAGTAARNLYHLGDRAFYPAGAPAVRIRFTPVAGAAAELTVHDPGLVLTARRLLA